MGYGYSYGYGYGSGSSYSYGYSSPPPPSPSSLSPPSLSPPILPAPPPCPFLPKPSPPVPVPQYSPPPSSPPPVPVPQYSPPPSSSPPPPVPVPDSPPPSPSLPPPVPVPETSPSPPPPVPVSSPPLASSPPLKTLKPHVELYYSPPPPIQPSSPPPAPAPTPPPISTQPLIYLSPPPPVVLNPPPPLPPPLAPTSPPPLPPKSPPLAPKSPPLAPISPPPSPNSPPPLPESPTVEPPISPPVSSPVSTPYITPPITTFPPPSPPKHIPSPSPPAPKPPSRPGAVNPNYTSPPSQNIVISREAAAAIVVVAGLVTLSFVGAAFWFVKQRRRVDEEETDGPMRHVRDFMAASAASPAVGGVGGVGGSQFSETTSGGPSGSRGTFPFPFPPGTKFSSSSNHPYSPSDQSLPASKQYFTYSDLSAFTSNFSPRNLLGEGGFGCVYKGVLADGREVAVKKLRESNGGQGEREFRAEVEIIGRVHHRHLVSLVGYCIAEEERVLVYDFVKNGTLYYHLHGNGGSVLSWSTRIKIAAGAARGIAYLHEDCHPRIIHRDIKSSNILIDNNFEAQVSDFGLARLAMDTNSHITTRVMGTFGYLAPEYALSGKLTAKSDVYSFGVVLLELITGRKPVDSSQPLGDESLVEWAKPYLMRALESRDFGELPDRRLEGRYDEVEMHRMIEAAAACVRHSSSMRPRMGQVVRALDSLVSDTNLTNGIPPGQSEIFEPQTEEIRMFQLREFGDGSSELSQASSRLQRPL